MKKIIKWLIAIALLGAVAISAFVQWNNRQPLSYADNLQENAYTLNGEEVLMSDLAFYIIYEERVVEEDALMYNPENTGDYWNAHIDGQFIRLAAKETVMGMSVHTTFFCQKAKEEGMTLTAEEEEAYRTAVADFYMDLLDEQREKLPVGDEYIFQEMRNIALAEKYQRTLVEKNGGTMASYNWDGFYYKEMLKEQDLKINDKIWEKISIGNITLDHHKVNYVNGSDGTKSKKKWF
ncbi:MAG: hypothetical protein K6B67_09430 [Lachnospiraceae bacterium]|nr:hypothetical protein [Lachnospiraceae bacterium]